MKQSELDLNDRLSAFKADRLMDAWNARNAAELARTDLGWQAFDVKWVPPSDEMWTLDVAQGKEARGRAGERTRPLGRGHKISCGTAVRADLEFVAPVIARVWAKNSNVVRAFDEAHLTEGWRWEWIPDPEAMKDAPSDFGWVRSAVCNEGGNDPIHRLTRGNKDRVTPPNHGHGAKCGCVVDGVPLDHPLATNPICPHCAGTGRIICDDERAGRVSPSHAAGGYAEWQRLSSVGIYAMYGEPATTERE